MNLTKEEKVITFGAVVFWIALMWMVLAQNALAV